MIIFACKFYISMKKILFSIFLFSCFNNIFSQQFIPYYATVSSQVSESNVFNTLTEFEDLGVKRRGTPALQNTLNWLKNKYQIEGVLNEIFFSNDEDSDECHLLL